MRLQEYGPNQVQAKVHVTIFDEAVIKKSNRLDNARLSVGRSVAPSLALPLGKCVQRQQDSKRPTGDLPFHLHLTRRGIEHPCGYLHQSNSGVGASVSNATLSPIPLLVVISIWT